MQTIRFNFIFNDLLIVLLSAILHRPGIYSRRIDYTAGRSLWQYQPCLKQNRTLPPFYPLPYLSRKYWGNEMSCKSSSFKRVMRKNVLRCNQRAVLCLSDNTPKKLRKNRETGTDFLGRVFSANSCQSQPKSQPKTVMPPVPHRKPVCDPLADRVASVSLRKAETRCWEVFRPLLRGMILPLEVSMSSTENTGMPEN